MAVCIPVSCFNDDLTRVVVSLLTFEAKNTYFENDTEGSGFSGYRVETHFDQKLVVLPFFFGIVFAQRYKLPLIMSRRRPLSQHNIVPRVNIIHTVTFREDQEMVVKEALSNLAKYRCTLLQLHPGFGKTRLSAVIAAHIKMVVMVIVHLSFLPKQFRKTFEEFTNAKVCFIDDYNPSLEADVYVCMVGSMHKIPAEVYARIGFLIVDEIHCMITGIRTHAIMNIDCKYLLFLTATPDKMNGLGEVIKAFGGESRVIRNFRKPFDVHLINTNINPVLETQRNSTKLDFNKYKKSLFYNEELNSYVVYTIAKNPGRKILVLTFEKLHVDLLYEMVVNRGLTASKYYGNQKGYTDANILIASVSKIGVGFDEETACEDFNGRRLDMLILLVSYRDINVLYQIIGRILRADGPCVIFFVNNSGVSTNHTKVLKSLCKDMPVSIYEHERNLAIGSKYSSDIKAHLAGLKTTPIPSDSIASVNPETDPVII